MKNTSVWILTLFFIFVSSAGLLQAHKLEVTLTQHTPVLLVEAGYSGHHHGLSAADVFIYAPGEAEKIFQTGKTDEAGKFAFIPTKAGEWRVVVDDGTGHRSEKALSLGDDFFRGEKAPPSRAQIPVLWKVMVGVSLLFGIAGILYGVKARKKSK